MDKKGSELLNETLFLPLDHRYNNHDMIRIINTLEEAQ